MPAASRASTDALHLPGGSHANEAGLVQLGFHSPSLMGRALAMPGTEAAVERRGGRGGGEEIFVVFAVDVVAKLKPETAAGTASAAVHSRIIPAGAPAGRGLAPCPSATSSSLHRNETAEASSAPKEIVAAEGRKGEELEESEELEGKLPPSPFSLHQREGGVASTSNPLEAAEASPWARTLKTCLPSSRALNETGDLQGFQFDEEEDFSLPSPLTRAHSNDPAPPPAAVPNSNSTSRLATTPSGPFRTVATTTSQRPAPLADDEAAAAAAAWALTKGLCAEAKTPVNSPSAASA